MTKQLLGLKTTSPSVNNRSRLLSTHGTPFSSVTAKPGSNNRTTLFDVTMGSYDGAEVCELVGLFILNSLAKKYGKERVGLYRDDGLILLSGTSARLADKARKDLHELFGEFQMKITAEITHQSVNFLDITFNLRDESYQPYRKLNNDPLYIDSRSNHPPAITKQLPTSVNMRISQLSSTQEASVLKTAPLYEAALRRSNYQADLKYSPNNSNKTRTRSRNIIWFNPPYSTNVRTNVGRNLLSLVDKHFPSSNPLHKIFNRNSVKVSHSCMNNCKSITSVSCPKVRQLQHQQRTAMVTVTAETPTIVYSKRIA